MTGSFDVQPASLGINTFVVSVGTPVDGIKELLIES